MFLVLGAAVAPYMVIALAGLLLGILWWKW